MRPRSAFVLFVALALALAAVALGACSSQGEGEVCDPKAGNFGSDDCQSGLVCTSNLYPGTNGFRCCPPPGTPATTLTCSGAQPGLDASTSPPDAAASGAEAGGDSAVDAPAEGGPADSSSDAAGDAMPDATSGAPADGGADSGADAAVEASGATADGGPG